MEGKEGMEPRGHRDLESCVTSVMSSDLDEVPKFVWPVQKEFEENVKDF